MSFFEAFVVSFSFLPAPIAGILFCAFAVFAVVLVLQIWQFIKDKIPFL